MYTSPTRRNRPPSALAQPKHRRSKLNRINSLLLVAIIAVNCYVIALPLVPGIFFWAEQHHTATARALESKLDQPKPTPAPAVPQTDRLIVPSMLLEEPIHTGASAKTLRQGLWLRPQGSTPDKGSNTVIVGHRFTYTNPRGVFYHLNKVSVGDHIGLYWQNKLHHYTVAEVRTVPATTIAVEARTEHATLTLYTCTPLWLPKDRLVVVATEDQPHE